MSMIEEILGMVHQMGNMDTLIEPLDELLDEVELDEELKCAILTQTLCARAIACDVELGTLLEGIVNAYGAERSIRDEKQGNVPNCIQELLKRASKAA